MKASYVAGDELTAAADTRLPLAERIVGSFDNHPKSERPYLVVGTEGLLNRLKKFAQ